MANNSQGAASDGKYYRIAGHYLLLILVLLSFVIVDDSDDDNSDDVPDVPIAIARMAQLPREL